MLNKIQYQKDKDTVVTLTHLFGNYYLKVAKGQVIQYQLCKAKENKKTGKMFFDFKGGYYGTMSQLLTRLKEEVVLDDMERESYDLIISKLITINELIQAHNLLTVVEWEE